MSKPAVLGRAATYEDLRAVPDHRVAEILGGDLWVSPRPMPRHMHVLTRLVMTLGPPFQDGNGGPGGWHFLSEVELHFGGDVLVPDLAGWKRDRKLDLMERAHISHSPDWICEVLSKSTATIDRRLKMGIYAREKVGHFWLIDARKRTLEVFKLVAGTWVPTQIFKDDAVAPAAPFETVPLALAKLWPD